MAIFGVLCSGRLGGVPPPSGARHGVLRVRLGRSEGWKPAKLEGCSGGKCPQNRDLGRLARDMAILPFGTAAGPVVTVGPRMAPKRPKTGTPGSPTRSVVSQKVPLGVPSSTKPLGGAADRPRSGTAAQLPVLGRFGPFLDPPPPPPPLAGPAGGACRGVLPRHPGFEEAMCGRREA